MDVNDSAVLQEKDRVIVLLNETAKAFQFQVASLQGQLTLATNQLAQRDMVVHDLQQHVQDLKNASADQNSTIAGLQSQLALQKATLDEVEGQLKTADADFEALRATFEAKDTDTSDKARECIKLNELIVRLQNEASQLNVVIRRQDKQLQEKATATVTTDACLSARDYSENQLISLRDDAIEAKAKELKLVTDANDGLRAQLDALEIEMESLQAVLTSKDVELHRNAKRIDRLDRQVATLEAAAKQAQGRELAMELSTKQNTQLLQCLQAEESKSEQLKQQVQALTTDLAHVRSQATQIRSEAAVVEIDVELKTKALERQSQNLTTSLEKLQVEREGIREELSVTRLKARVEVEGMQGELIQRRTKQYELTLKLHETESQLHTLRTTTEGLDEELQATRSRMQELDRLYADAKRWKADMTATLDAMSQENSHLQRTLAVDTKRFQVESAALHDQLKELERFVQTQAIQLGKADDAKTSAAQDMQKMNHQIEGMQERIHGLVAEANAETKRRMGVEMELTIAHEQLQQLQANSQSMLAGCYVEHKKLQDGKNKLKQLLQQLEAECKREQLGTYNTVICTLLAHDS
ncbi:hypothetical protein, variant [Aphanomyces astaci]|uniref:Uncharacterized protein n=1 Tax=Aphanomyces astaci TaxID=112090 RepID=W4FVC8_APHAT|nr:hypothetical protein, variant [Aphanomyces astaci]ETV70769.1 hypothetical protein, variant [Aphanomyces astaci]|eukprot:XP_009839832.1 hypothetical protein, variant [Aphanomyces astaci]